MSALSVLSSIAPTAAGGTASASPDAATSDGLFAGLLAAVAPPTKATGGNGEAALDRPAAEAEAVDGSALEAAVVAAPAWPPIILVAPAPAPSAPSLPSETAEAGSAGASPPAPGLDASPSDAPAPITAPTASATPAAAAAPSVPNAAKAPVITPSAEPVPATTTPPTQGAKTTPAVPSRAVELPAISSPSQNEIEPPVQDAQQRPVTTEAALRPAPTAAADAGQTLASPRPDTVDTPSPQVEPSLRQTTPASDDGIAVQPAPSPIPDGLGVSVAADEPRREAAPQARPAASAPTAEAIIRAVSSPVAPASQSPLPAEPLKTQTDAPRVETAQQPAQAAPAVIAPAPRPQMATPAQPLAPPPADAADAPDPTADAIASDPESVEGQAAQAKSAAPLPTPAAPAAPPRAGSSRLDDRPSNAATSSAQTDAPTDAKSEALSGPRTASPAGVAASTTPSETMPSTLTPSDSLAAKPVAPADAAPLDASAAPDLAPSQQVLDAQNATPAASRDLGLSQLSRATVETTAQLAAQILKKLDGRSTRFDMALTPEGLGRVDVSMEIDAEGHLTARLAFDNPAAATELRGRADELRRQLQDAGFQLTPDSLEFSDRNPSSGFGGGGAFDRAPDRRAFTGAARVAADADTVLPPPGAWTSLSQTRDRVDLKV